MSSRYLKAVLIGILAGVVLLIAYLIFLVLGFVGGFFVPFLSCAVGCVQWLAMAAFLVGVGWYTANYTWAVQKGDAISVSALAGVVAGILSQSIGLIIGLVLSPIVGIIGAILGYALAGGNHPWIYALILGTGGIMLVLAITAIQFLFWVAIGTVFCMLGGAMYATQSKK